MLLSQRLEHLSIVYDDSRRTVSRFLIEQGPYLEQYTMQQIADATYTSKATLVRIAKQLGFTGWRPFANAYLAELRRQSERRPGTDPNRPFVAGDPVATIAENICRVHEEGARRTLELNETADFARATSLLWNADRLSLFGISVNELLLKSFQRKMLTIGAHVTLVPQSEYGIEAASLGEDDCALIVSYSGDNDERAPMRQIEEIKRHGARIVALTSAGSNYLRNMADCALTILSQECLYSKIATFSTEESISLLLDTLFSCYFARDYKRHWDYKLSSAEAAEVNRRADHDRLDR